MQPEVHMESETSKINAIICKDDIVDPRKSAHPNCSVEIVSRGGWVHV